MKTMMMKKISRMKTNLEMIIFELLEAGEDMVDGAQTCGHDEAVEAWEETSKRARKAINSDAVKAKIEEGIKATKIAAEERRKKKEAKFLKDQRSEDTKILASFGLGLSGDGKILGLNVEEQK